MESAKISHYRDLFQAVKGDFESLDCAEDRLAWLMDRAALHEPVAEEYCTPERRVPGCLSGLWLTHDHVEGLLWFKAKSESALVQGVVSFLCDLYSGRSVEEILSIGRSLADELGLEGLLTVTRRRAVESTVQFFVQQALHNSIQVCNG